MKKTIDIYQFRQAFADYNRQDNFSYEALRAIFEYFEELEDDTGEEIELDVIAICCEVTEMTYEDFISYYDVDAQGDSKEEIIGAVIDCIDYNSMVIGKFEDTVVFFDY